MSLSSMQRDLDLDAIWDLFTQALRDVFITLRDAGCVIRGLGFAAHRQTLIVEDADGEILLASGNDDLRAAMQGAAIDEASGSLLLRDTGHSPAMIFWPGKLAWIDAFALSVRDRAAKLLSLETWMVQRMVGNSHASACSAVETGAWHLGDERWANEHLPSWSQTLLPTVVDVTSAGFPTRSFASETGIPLGCSIAPGQPDTQTGELATRGLQLAGSDFAAVGWSATVVRPIGAGHTIPHVWHTCAIGGGRLAESNAGEAASGYQWLRRSSSHGELTEFVTGSRCAVAEGVFAPTGLRVMGSSQTGLGFAAMLAPIPFAVDVPDMDVLGTAVLEDVGFAVRANREQLGTDAYVQEPIRLTGGYVAPAAAAQLLANVLGSSVAVFTGIPVTAVGAAMCAASASGDMSLSDAQVALSPEPTLVEPDTVLARAYDDYHAHWLELRRILEAFVQDSL